MDFVTIIVMLAIFLLPEIINSKKKKKYEYPDENYQPPTSAPAPTETQIDIELPPEEPATWTGGASVPSKIQTDWQTALQNSPIPFGSPNTEKAHSHQTLPTFTQHKKRIDRKKVLQGLIMSEIVAKPRALRPLEPVQLYRAPRSING